MIKELFGIIISLIVISPAIVVCFVIIGLIVSLFAGLPPPWEDD